MQSVWKLLHLLYAETWSLFRNTRKAEWPFFMKTSMALSWYKEAQSRMTCRKYKESFLSRLYDYLQKETHETGLLDIIVEPSSAFAWWLFSQHRGNKGIPHTGGGEQTQINDWEHRKVTRDGLQCKCTCWGGVFCNTHLLWDWEWSPHTTAGSPSQTAERPPLLWGRSPSRRTSWPSPTKRGEKDTRSFRGRHAGRILSGRDMAAIQTLQALVDWSF